MSDTIMQTASDGSQQWVKISGPATMKISPAFVECLEQLSGGDVSAIHVELSECEWIDSTFAGSLIGYSRAAETAGKPQLCINAPSERCLQSLKQMNLHHFLQIENLPLPQSLEWDPYTASGVSANDLADTIVRAHERLAEAVPENPYFGRVAATFKGDQQRRESD